MALSSPRVLVNEFQAWDTGSAEARFTRPYAAPTDLCSGEVALERVERGS